MGAPAETENIPGVFETRRFWWLVLGVPEAATGGVL